MNRTRTAALIGLFVGLPPIVGTTDQGQAPEKPTVAALFSGAWNAPAFWVECRNPSTGGIARADFGWINAYRIDGTLPPLDGRGGSGSAIEVAPGDKWHGILDLRQSGASATRPINSGANGAYSRLSVLHPLSAGRHTIAVQCFDTWSDDFVFVWEPPRSP
jgi:hypothetical protein